jgi:hypothetical protein
VSAKGTKVTYAATLPDGHVVTRTTNRRYTHAVALRAVYPADATEEWKLRDSGRWVLVGFCGSHDLAGKLARTTDKLHRGRCGAVEVDVRTVEAVQQ